MAGKTKKPMRRVGVGAQYTCFGDPLESIPFESDITKNETVTSIETNEGGSPENVWASNKIYDVDKSGDAPVLNMENLAFDPGDLARMKGKRREGAFLISGTLDEGEKFARGIVYPKKNGHVTYVWYPRCVLTEVSDAAQTMDDGGPNTQNPSSTIQVLPFNDENEYRVEYDTELLAEGETPLTEEEFFAAVLTEPIPEG
ncbi:hypothetical protein LJC74_03885 [Eubacteriales bacterium OttesenSCG-928-A19]|nr:hypothetical protein [Eubacteriales bacterium OttesenSCG-928-A19]